MLKHIPNTLTMLNLLSGCVGVVQISQGRFVSAAACIVLSAILDFFDGSAARWLKAFSSIGKDLDSLADVVSFGVLPSYMLFQWLNLLTSEYILSFQDYYAYLAFLPVVSSAIRLARFNHDETQKHSFRGLPTPAHALFWAAVFMALVYHPCLNASSDFRTENFSPSSLAYSQTGCPLWIELFLSPYFIILLAFLFTWLLNAPIRLFSFKFTSYKIQDNLFLYLFLLSSLILIFWKGFASAPIILFLYLLFSVLHFRKIKNT
ncbi:MAG: CDP-alcohol phosphatidyltransferase family protein [Flavobacteriales bacterium]|nr:CDP-alcohol phosphatidyltransferase family protein [Flavobacteriales bacterium]